MTDKIYKIYDRSIIVCIYIVHEYIQNRVFKDIFEDMQWNELNHRF